VDPNALIPRRNPTPGAARARRSRARRHSKAETQARILEAAVALFAARGYDGASISAIAARAGVSRGAVFWHFSEKDTLFQEAFRCLLIPFVEQLKATLEHLDARKRLFELFDVYEQFVARQRDTIESIVRWVLESPTLRSRLQRPLLALVDEFVRDVRASLEELCENDGEAAALAAALACTLHGSLLLSFLDPNAERHALRRAGLRLIAEHVLGPDDGARGGGGKP
jgi:AcrR family transcriptional regulator